ncbi:hypothetical protein LTR36_005811 [Oleoguttula mirabilis]|uniref:Uncharacterized protein n=1 Tax=Oleoguttula mirabilis TaxID=1507867 RepID=A0AAV9JFH9_9PEZI|nr:hypothetical protein LTR36_005811 [Oleoguttula mirabilis]
MPNGHHANRHDANQYPRNAPQQLQQGYGQHNAYQQQLDALMYPSQYEEHSYSVRPAYQQQQTTPQVVINYHFYGGYQPQHIPTYQPEYQEHPTAQPRRNRQRPRKALPAPPAPNYLEYPGQASSPTASATNQTARSIPRDGPGFVVDGVRTSSAAKKGKGKAQLRELALPAVASAASAIEESDELATSGAASPMRPNAVVQDQADPVLNHSTDKVFDDETGLLIGLQHSIHAHAPKGKGRRRRPRKD